MKLHHFCRTSDLETVSLKRACTRMWPMRRLCRWGTKTTQETTATTDEDVEHYRRLGLWTEEEIDETWRHGWLLDTGRTHRLTVRVRSGSKLQNYGDWLREWRRGDHRRKRDGTGQRCWRTIRGSPHGGGIIAPGAERVVDLLWQNSAEHDRGITRANKKEKEAVGQLKKIPRLRSPLTNSFDRKRRGWRHKQVEKCQGQAAL
jgi:hypothetical protein